jgi:glycosyltransferase involved in cell wall biosynthesis
MRILSLTAGAATMYCGSCLRDNAIAIELIARGHEVTLLPVYTPTVTDEPNASQKRVFFGGVSVYLQQHVPLFRKTPAFLDRLWDSSRFIRWVSKRSLATDGRFLGEMTVSMLKGEHGHQRKELDKLIAWLHAHYPNPDVVNLPFALLIGLAGPIRKALGSRIVCTLQGEDLFLDQLQEPWRAEALALIRQQVPDVDLFVAVSDYYTRAMPDYLGIPPERIRTVPLGINFKDFDYITPYVPGRAVKRTTSPQWPEPARPFTIGYFARIAPEKGLDRLVEAYRILRQERDVPPARLEAAGWMGADQKPYLASIEQKLRESGLAGEFKYRGELSRLDKVRFLSQLDVFSMPAPYKEPKGLSVLEAMAAGVPVVQPAHGAFAELVLRTGGGMLVAPDDPEALAEGLWQLWQDATLRAKLGQRGAAGVRQHYGIARSAERVEKVYEEAIHRKLEAESSPGGSGSSQDTQDSLVGPGSSQDIQDSPVGPGFSRAAAEASQESGIEDQRSEVRRASKTLRASG